MLVRVGLGSTQPHSQLALPQAGEACSYPYPISWSRCREVSSAERLYISSNLLGTHETFTPPRAIARSALWRIPTSALYSYERSESRTTSMNCLPKSDN